MIPQAKACRDFGERGQKEIGRIWSPTGRSLRRKHFGFKKTKTCYSKCGSWTSSISWTTGSTLDRMNRICFVTRSPCVSCTYFSLRSISEVLGEEGRLTWSLESVMIFWVGWKVTWKVRYHVERQSMSNLISNDIMAPRMNSQHWWKIREILLPPGPDLYKSWSKLLLQLPEHREWRVGLNKRLRSL